MNTYSINDITLRNHRAYFNEAYRNERSMEVALGLWFLDRFGATTLEVGCVLPYYLDEAEKLVEHEVFDLADEHPKSKKINALTYDYKGRNVLSISTIEHMSTKEYGNGSDEDSITFLHSVLDNSSKFLITWAVGYNFHLDNHLKTHPEIQRLIMRRTNWKNEWVKHFDSNDFSAPFGHSDRPIPEGYFNNANAVCVVTNMTELL